MLSPDVQQYKCQSFVEKSDLEASQVKIASTQNQTLAEYYGWPFLYKISQKLVC